MVKKIKNPNAENGALGLENLRILVKSILQELIRKFISVMFDLTFVI